MTTSFTVPLRGAGGEPVDLWRTLQSHGLTELPPMSVDPDERALTVTLPVGRGRARTVTIESAGVRRVRCTIHGRPPANTAQGVIERGITHILRLDEDLSEFYEQAAQDPDLAWAASGAGRMLRSASTFEEVVKTVCTTNCSWGATTKMIGALVANLGARAPGAPADGAAGRAFPTPVVMAAQPESFYRDVIRSGYRGRYFIALATSVADGTVDLEALAAAPRDELDDDELERQLLALPGVGPYAAAHIMMMIGRYSRLILDSWTRPKYARLVGKKTVPDKAIVTRFRRYGSYAGLAFWLFLTHDWIEDVPAKA
ncbi:MAG TPA: Fe-S cluster assembly protein HesB [Actinomycetota bacterium]|nr:Fe-S cluster assembly protein HesB [Actinomycetota bacterium]